VAAREFVFAALSLALGFGGGCMKPLSSQGRATSNVPALAQSSLAHAEGTELPFFALLIGQGDVWAIDPITGQERWRRPLRAFGEPAVSGSFVLVPVLGQELVALDAADGNTLWSAPIPGEALTGIAADRDGVIVTALSDRRRFRSVMLGLSRVDGAVRWRRESRALLGDPAALGGQGFVPFEDSVAVVSTRSGRILGRMRAVTEHPLERVERHGDMLLAACPEGFVDLQGGGRRFYPVSTGEIEVFDERAGFAPWLGDREGIEFRLLAGLHPGAPRDAIFMGRRVLAALRLDPRGRPIDVRWIHVQAELEEFVALEVTRSAVWVMREDGALLQFDPSTGRRAAGIVTRGPIIGATFVGGEPGGGLPEQMPRRSHTTLTRMLLLLDDPDPRLLPAQSLVLEVLWRSPYPDIRAHVQDLAAGTAPSVLVRKAQELASGAVWGLADELSLATTLRTLEHPAAAKQLGFAELAKDVVRSGGPEALERLVELLADPGTPAAALEAIMIALRSLDDPRSVPGVAGFVRRYYADPEVADESLAIFLGLEVLLSQAALRRPPRRDPAVSDEALALLREILAAEFTAPKVRAFLRERMSAS